MRWTGQIFWLLAYDAYSAPHLPPAFTVFCGGPERFRGTTKERRRNACHYNDWPNGKSYPVTAAQLLPILTGFLAPIHFFKLAKNWIEK
jgi:hypothetical protein